MNPQLLVILLITLPAVFGLRIEPEESELVLKHSDHNSAFTLTCFDRENVTWSYPQNEDSIHTLDYHQEDGMHVLVLNVRNTTYMDTGYYVCKNLVPKIDAEYSSIYVYVFDERHYLAIKDEYTTIQSGENRSITIPCKPTSPNITVKLINSEDDYELNLPYDPKKGFELKSPRVRDSRLVRCRANISDSIDEMMFQIFIMASDPSAKPFISIAEGSMIAAEGNSLSLNCSVRLKIGCSVFLNWKYPNDDVKNRSQELSQQEFFLEDGKINYKILTISNFTKSDMGNYTCEVEDPYSENKANQSYYLEVFDASKSFLNFKILTDTTYDFQTPGSSKLLWFFNVTSYPAAKIYCKLPSGQVFSTTNSSIPDKYQLVFTDKLLKFVVLYQEMNDIGTYEFTADNGFQKKTVNAYIKDANKPFLDFKVKNGEKNYVFNTGKPKIRLVFKIASNLAAKVYCKVPNGQVISSVGSSSSKYQLSMIGNSVEFVMYQLEVNDSGTYEFTADNGAEKKTLSIVIRIKG